MVPRNSGIALHAVLVCPHRHGSLPDGSSSGKMNMTTIPFFCDVRVDDLLRATLEQRRTRGSINGTRCRVSLRPVNYKPMFVP